MKAEGIPQSQLCHLRSYKCLDHSMPVVIFSLLFRLLAATKWARVSGQTSCLSSDMSAPVGFRVLPLPIAQLSLDAVLRCGQSFRWFAYPLFLPAETPRFGEPTHEYRFALQDRVVCLRQSHTHLFYRSIYPDHAKDASRDLSETSTLTWIRDYFQLDVDLVKLYSEWSGRDDVFRRTINERFAGIRILRQDPWENVASWVFTVYTRSSYFPRPS